MPPLLLLAATLLPDLLRVFANDRGSGIGERVTDAVKKTFGTDDKAEIEKKIQEDPAAKAALQIRLAEIAAEATQEQHRAEEERRRLELEFYQDQLAEADRARQAEFERYKVDLADRGAARDRQTQLETSDSIFAWVAPILAATVTGGLIFLLYLLVTTRNDLQNKDVFNALLGAVTTAFITIVNFYFGSSVGSKEKDNLIAKGQLVSADPSPERPPPTPPPADPARGTPPAGPKSPGATPYPPPTGPFALFRDKAPKVMRRLIGDFSLTEIQAAGVLGNIGHECNGFRTFQEGGIRSGRGGWGWLQWTGPRRRQFESWIATKGFEPTSDEANYGFLSFELNGAEGARTLGPLRRASNINSATQIFMQEFERPGIPHLDSRIKYANMALDEFRRSA